MSLPLHQVECELLSCFSSVSNPHVEKCVLTQNEIFYFDFVKSYTFKKSKNVIQI